MEITVFLRIYYSFISQRVSTNNMISLIIIYNVTYATFVNENNFAQFYAHKNPYIRVDMVNFFY